MGTVLSKKILFCKDMKGAFIENISVASGIQWIKCN